MNDSFVFYGSFHEAFKDLNDEQYGKIMRIINEYALNETLPEIKDNLLRVAFTLIKPQLDANFRRREVGSKGGRPAKTDGLNSNNSNKTIGSENENHRLLNEKPMVSEEITYGFEEENHRLENEKPNVNVNVNDNVNVNENENVNVGPESTETLQNETAAGQVNEISLTPSQKAYSKKIFNIFKTAGLFCANGNEISFLQRDFYNAIGFIHSQKDLKALHSSDIIKACENYAAVYKAPDTYYKTKLDFYSFVKSKQFWKFLPANFDMQNYKKWDASGASETTPENDHANQYEICPKCNSKKLWWSNDKQLYICDACHQTLSWEQKEGEE